MTRLPLAAALLLATGCAAAPDQPEPTISDYRVDSSLAAIERGILGISQLVTDQQFATIKLKLDEILVISARAEEKADRALIAADRKSESTIAQQTGLVGLAGALGVGGFYGGKRRGRSSSNGDDST